MIVILLINNKYFSKIYIYKSLMTYYYQFLIIIYILKYKSIESILYIDIKRHTIRL